MKCNAKAILKDVGKAKKAIRIMNRYGSVTVPSEAVIILLKTADVVDISIKKDKAAFQFDRTSVALVGTKEPSVWTIGGRYAI